MKGKYQFIPFLYVFFIFSFFAALALIGWQEVWNGLYLFNPYQPFTDLGAIAKGVLAANRFGNAYSDYGPYNYPLIWITLGNLIGIDVESRRPLIASIIVGIFVGSNFLFLKRYPSWTLLIISFSASALYAFQICNNDLIIISIATLGILSESRVANKGLLLLAGLLKIYPLSAFCVTATSRKEFFCNLILSIGALLLFFPQIYSIRHATPYSAFSYGITSLSMTISLYSGLKIDPILIAAFLVIFPLAYTLFEKPTVSEVISDKKPFHVGAMVYLSTFLLVGGNFPVRTIFLFYCVPGILSLKSRWKKSLLIGAIGLISNLIYLGQFHYGLVIYSVASVILFEWLAIETVRSGIFNLQKPQVRSVVHPFAKSA